MAGSRRADHGRRAPRGVAAVAVLALLALGSCGGRDATPPDDRGGVPDADPIRIGAKNFTEQRILGELYRQSLVAEGFPVELKADIGSTEIIHRVLRRGSLDLYPEYIGVLLSEIAGVQTPQPSAKAAYERADRFEREAGFMLLDQTPFSNSNGLGVKPAFARRHKLRSVGDLRRLPGRVRIAALSEFRTRHEGLVGLRERYGVRNADVVDVKADGRYAALERDDADVAVVFRTDAQLAGDDYVVLADPKQLFASGHVAPVVGEKLLAQRGPRLRSAIDAVTRALTTTAMRQMNADVDIEGREPAAVATDFLREHALL